MYFICLYIYSNLLQVNPFYLLVHLFLIALEFVMICFQLSKKSAFGTIQEKYHQNILKWDFVLIILMGATQWWNWILILMLDRKIIAFLNQGLILHVLMSSSLSL